MLTENNKKFLSASNYQFFWHLPRFQEMLFILQNIEAKKEWEVMVAEIDLEFIHV